MCFVKIAQKFDLVLVLLLASSVLVLVRPNDDTRLTAFSDVSNFVSRRPRTEFAPADEIDTQFNELFSMFATLMVFSRDPSDASCVVTAGALVTVDCSSLASRGSLFVVILLVLSGPDGIECLLSSTFSPPSLHHHQCRRCCLVGSRPARVPVASISWHHSCRCPGQSLWWCWVACLMQSSLGF